MVTMTTASASRSTSSVLAIVALLAVTSLAIANTQDSPQTKAESRQAVLEEIVKQSNLGYEAALESDKSANDAALAARVKESSDLLNQMVSRYQRLPLDKFEDTVLNTELKPAQNLLAIALKDFETSYVGKPASPAARKMILEDMAQSRDYLEHTANRLLEHTREAS